MSAAVTLVRCTVRVGKPDDLAFVVDSWTKNGHRGERMRTATAHVRALLARETAALYIAHVPGEPDAILGWVVLEGGRPACVHYAYVRNSARGMGVARAMLSGVMDQAVEYSVHAPASVRVPLKWVFNALRAKT